jgi:hypothetical protein
MRYAYPPFYDASSIVDLMAPAIASTFFLRTNLPWDYTLWLEFENNEKRVFDVAPYLEIGVFKHLKDCVLFSRARIEGGTVSWPGEIDIAPETLYECSIPASLN